MVAREHPLLIEESDLLGSFYPTLVVGRLRLFEGGLLSAGAAARTLGYRIYLAPELRFFGANREPLRHLLVHESMHALQAQHLGFRYITGALEEQLHAFLDGDVFAAYRYRLSPERPLKSYGYEQQAQMMEDYYSWRHEGVRAARGCLDYVELGREQALSIMERRWRELLSWR